MARLRSGILGNIRGKVAGVVGGQWKDKNYVREYVKPANPNTAAQQTQRTKMSDIVAFCKPLTGQVFNPYTDRFQKSMSGFNFFIKQNIADFDGSPPYSTLKITEGKLFCPIGTPSDYTPGTGANVLHFSTDLGNNGAATDKVFACTFDESTGLWYFAGAEVARSTGTITVTCDTGLTDTNLHNYQFAAKYSNTLVDMISDSSHSEASEV